tara:strand:+ start:45 stop:434 length:390 start_codon:yes stop_codon:yes gene_type:complete
MKEQDGLLESQSDENAMAQFKDALKEIRLPSDTKPDLKDRIKHLFSPSAEFERCIVDVEDFTISSLESYEKRIKQLEEALKDLVKISLEMVEKIENEWGTARDIEDLRGKNLIDKEIITAELLLNKEQP